MREGNEDALDQMVLGLVYATWKDTGGPYRIEIEHNKPLSPNAAAAYRLHKDGLVTLSFRSRRRLDWMYLTLTAEAMTPGATPMAGRGKSPLRVSTTYFSPGHKVYITTKDEEFTDGVEVTLLRVNVRGQEGFLPDDPDLITIRRGEEVVAEGVLVPTKVYDEMVGQGVFVPEDKKDEVPIGYPELFARIGATYGASRSRSACLPPLGAAEAGVSPSVHEAPAESDIVALLLREKVAFGIGAHALAHRIAEAWRTGQWVQ